MWSPVVHPRCASLVLLKAVSLMASRCTHAHFGPVLQEHATTNMVFVRPGDPLANKVVEMYNCDERGTQLDRVPGYGPTVVAFSVLTCRGPCSY